ncbi:MAG: HU family DNA-binding protein [bacterium]
MNKSTLIHKVSADAHVKKSQSVRTIKALVGAIRETMKSGDKISLAGLGTFRAKARKARKGRNPKTGETIQIPAGRKISFKPSLSLKKLIK